ncbi:hypothetical protein RHSIM_Rhsim05G0106900 [Rhododendron simsii]|uniref:Uncharacterized protein n=1 Tax=Rhododendron simsii TaxID=118357 RepID=A0A834GW77_RHOSS|nr:hypothetical protein RHSIM_Rhsim05G0106900 [Rhododendron simsii]
MFVFVDIGAFVLIALATYFSGRLIHGREIMVQFAKYGPNAERIDKGRVIEPVPRTSSRLRSSSPRRRYRDDYHRDYDYPRRRSRSRSLDRYDRDRYRGRERDYRRRSRSRSASPDYDRGRGKGRYDDDKSRSRSRSFESASPRRDSLSPRRSLPPRKKPSSRGESPDRRSYDERSPTPRSVSPRRRPADSRSPSPRNSDLDVEFGTANSPFANWFAFAVVERITFMRCKCIYVN